MLELQLKYIKALQAEHIATTDRTKLVTKNLTTEKIIEALEDTRRALQSGEITIEQAKEETSILSAELRAITLDKGSKDYCNIPIVITDESMILD